VKDLGDPAPPLRRHGGSLLGAAPGVKAVVSKDAGVSRVGPSRRRDMKTSRLDSRIWVPYT
jgi:hypothetical protein